MTNVEALQFEQEYFDRIRRSISLLPDPAVYPKLDALINHRADIAKTILEMENGQGKEYAMTVFNQLDEEIKKLLAL